MKKLVFCCLWRRGRDSNPRCSFPHTRFPGVHLKPLGHLSKHTKFSKLVYLRSTNQLNSWQYYKAVLELASYILPFRGKNVVQKRAVTYCKN